MRDDKLQEIIELLPYSIRYSVEIEELLDYAREQAERVDELEGEVFELKVRLEGAHKYNDAMKMIADDYKKQNKRYREALEEILAESYEEAGLHPDTNMQLETFIAKIARKALEGEE